MSGNIKCLRDYARAAWQMSAYGVLVFFWGIIFQVFLIKMLPRLGYLAGRPIANDPPCINPECDFSAFWPAGLLARQHDFLRIYDSAAFLAVQRHILVGSANLDAFFYPPTMLLPSMLISHLPYEVAFFVWTILGLALSVWLLRRVGFSWLVILAGLSSPAALWNTELGQLGTIGGAILLAGVALSPRAPLRAGVLLGLLACKPQIGVLVPAMLAGQRSLWGVIGFAAACAILFALTLAYFGPSCWAAYHAVGSPHAMAVLNAPFNAHAYAGGGVSIFWMLRSLQAGLPMAYAVQGVFTLLAMLGAVYIWRRRDLMLLDQIALTAFLSLLATPYGYGDDMVAYSIALAALAERRGWRIGMPDVLFWLWPALCQPIAMATGILFTPVVVALLLGRTWWRAGVLRSRRVVLAA